MMFYDKVKQQGRVQGVGHSLLIYTYEYVYLVSSVSFLMLSPNAFCSKSFTINRKLILYRNIINIIT